VSFADNNIRKHGERDNVRKQSAGGGRKNLGNSFDSQTWTAYLAESAGDDAAGRTAAHDDEVVLLVRQDPRQRTTARVLDVALRPDEHLQQAHEQHERRPAARAGQRRPRLGHRAVAAATHPEVACRTCAETVRMHLDRSGNNPSDGKTSGARNNRC